ncbi:hypothetical protein [Streptomyces sp. NBC_00842]|uniref:hypothetical protein n=1 Tax=Streptomyces sp. NBC_00842 TaxID=2975848 RepID=UPI002F90C56E|nr:hypothetical protein OH821_44505 [Streptomyces sp. NBC_00842]
MNESVVAALRAGKPSWPEAARAAVYKAEQQRLAEEKEPELEARRPVCTGCGTRFTDIRREAVQLTDWG